MVRKFAAALVALTLFVGAVFAEEVKGTFVKFADGKLTIKVDDKDKDYKVPSDLKVKRGKAGSEKEYNASDVLGKAKEGAKMTVTVEDGTVKDFKMERMKKELRTR